MPLNSRRLTITLAGLGLAAIAVTAMAVARPPSVMPLKEAAVTPVPVVASKTLPATAAETAAPRPAPPATAPEKSVYGEAGMRIAIDPETGVAGAAPMSIERSEAEALSRSTEGLREVVLPDGSVMIDLQGRFQEHVVMEVGPDGKRRMRCVSQPAVAREEAPVQ